VLYFPIIRIDLLVSSLATGIMTTWMTR